MALHGSNLTLPSWHSLVAEHFLGKCAKNVLKKIVLNAKLLGLGCERPDLVIIVIIMWKWEFIS